MRAAWMFVGVIGLAVARMGEADGAKNAGDVVSVLHDGQGKDAGKVTFKQTRKGVKVKVELRGLPIGVHAVHIHQNAVCEGPDFKTAGPHFNPDGKQHGFENPMGHHNGDTPVNVTVQEGYRGEATFVMLGISLDKAAPNSLFLNGGTSVVVHEKADDMKTDPSGMSGNRIACGVIQ